MRAAVVVLGDLSRSPRTVLHALALDRAGLEVDLIGFATAGWTLEAASPRLTVRPIPSGAAMAPWRPYALRAVLRGVALCWHLMQLLFWGLPRPHLILVQNPPGVPTLAIAWAAARVRGARFIIDWHNLTASMLALRLGPRHSLIRSTSAYEGFFSRRADHNLFVSGMMRDTLAKKWGARGAVFRDRPGSMFQPFESAERLDARNSLLARFGESGDAVLAVSSTSWSADEDFDLLLRALVRYERLATSGGISAKRLVIVITGRGPLRDSFVRRFAESDLQHVGVHTAWLELGDYSRLLAAADVGICLHRSASGLDLPMKVLDMFGAGLPVCALDYGPCLRELVVEGTNGIFFKTDEELAQILQSICRDPAGTLDALRSGVADARMPTWELAWENEVRQALAPVHRTVE